MKRIAMPNRIVEVKGSGGHNLHITFRDGATFDLDFLPLIEQESGSKLIDPLLEPAEFHKVQIDYGTLVFSTGYDICPDVLRFWCEKGGVCSQRETDTYFEEMFSQPVAEGK